MVKVELHARQDLSLKQIKQRINLANTAFLKGFSAVFP